LAAKEPEAPEQPANSSGGREDSHLDHDPRLLGHAFPTGGVDRASNLLVTRSNAA
jgi:hypothetical protein